MELRFEHLVEAPIEAVFAFHENPANLALLLEEWDAFRLIHHDGHIHVGSTTWFEVGVARFLPVVLGFVHTVYEPPHRFAEELIHGPFRRFVHIHEFAGSANGTVVRDLLNVSLPWWYGGESAMNVWLRSALERVFDTRGRALARIGPGCAVSLVGDKCAD